MEEQISHLRAQLLRSEQDNELMRIKLEQETAEREKAQKQVNETAAHHSTDVMPCLHQPSSPSSLLCKLCALQATMSPEDSTVG